MSIRSWMLVCNASLGLSIAGCGGDLAPKKLERVEVKGVVTLDGKPLGGANLRFIPISKTPGKGGWGLTGEDGHYTAKSSDGEEQMPIGEYQVLVTVGAPPEDADAPPPSKSAGGVFVPPIYGDAGRSPLVVGFHKGAGEANIELRSK